MAQQYAPDITLLQILQDKYAANAGRSTLGSSVGLNRQAAYDPNRVAQRLIANPANALKSTQFAVQQDYALRNSGLNPDQTVRGAPLVSYGGRTFLSQNRGGATFQGDVGSFAKELRQYIQGYDKLAVSGQAGLGQGNRLADANRRAAEAQFGNLSAGTGMNLANTFNTLTGTQRQQLVQESGLSVDRLIQFQNQYAGTRGGLTEVTGRPDPNAPSVGESALRQTIQNRQAANGLFQSNVSAAAEGQALSAFTTSRQAQSAGTVLGGILDPNKAQYADVLGYQNSGGVGQLAFGQEVGQKAQILAALAQAQPQGQVVQRTAGQNRLNTNFGRTYQTTDYMAANPLRFLENPVVAENFNIGYGASFGV